METFCRVYIATIDRYSYTIRGIFTGHTHVDEFNVYYDSKVKDKVIAVNWIAPSVTTFGSINPSFRVFEVDSETL